LDIKKQDEDSLEERVLKSRVNRLEKEDSREMNEQFTISQVSIDILE